MAVTRGELQADIYEILSKSPTAYGLLTPTKVNKMIQDSLDYIAAKMLKIGGGWLTKIVYANFTAGNPYVDLPAGLAIVNFIKILGPVDGEYTPINFNENADGVTQTTQASAANFNPFYRFSSGKLYLEPVPKESKTNGLLFDGVFFPDRLLSDGAEIDGDMDNFCFVHYAKWRAASALFSLTSKNDPPWARFELQWQQQCEAMIARRFREPTPIKRFSDY